MTQYLIKKKNRFGRFVHVDTIREDPARADLVRKYGFGEYSVMVAENGVPGLHHYNNYIFAPTVKMLGWNPHGTVAAEAIQNMDRNPDNVREQLGLENGYYYMAEVTNVRPLAVAPPTEDVSEVLEALNSGSVALRGYVSFKIIGGLPGGQKQCPRCHTFTHLESEVCKQCQYQFI